MSPVHSVPLSAKRFIPEDLKLSLLYVNPIVHPGLYDKKLTGDLKFVDRRIMSIKDIEFDTGKFFTEVDLKLGPNNSQQTQSTAIRANGVGENADDVTNDINTNGYELSHIPISVARCPNDKDMILDGRTRLYYLLKMGFTNVIVDYYTCASWETYFTQGLVRNPKQKPYSPMKKEDVIGNCHFAIKSGWIKKNPTDISKHVRKIAGNTFAYNILQKIIHNVMYGESHTAAVISLSDDTAKAWLKRNGYFDNDKGNGIYYKVVSASAWTKAIAAAAKTHNELLENGCRVKELRIILHTGTLEGADPIKSWQGKIDTFRTGWRENLTDISRAFHTEYTNRAIIKVYGVIPAVGSLSEQHPMDKLVMFHVGKLKEKSFAEINLEESIGVALA
jgi:hypothetical protein